MCKYHSGWHERKSHVRTGTAIDGYDSRIRFDRPIQPCFSVSKLPPSIPKVFSLLLDSFCPHSGFKYLDQIWPTSSRNVFRHILKVNHVSKGLMTRIIIDLVSS